MEWVHRENKNREPFRGYVEARSNTMHDHIKIMLGLVEQRVVLELIVVAPKKHEKKTQIGFQICKQCSASALMLCHAFISKIQNLNSNAEIIIKTKIRDISCVGSVNNFSTLLIVNNECTSE